VQSNPRPCDAWHPWSSHFAATTRAYRDGQREYALVDVVAAAFAPYGSYTRLIVVELPMTYTTVDGLVADGECAALDRALSAVGRAMRQAHAIPVAEVQRESKASIWIYAREGGPDHDELAQIATSAAAPYRVTLRICSDPLWSEYHRILGEPEYVDRLAADAVLLQSFVYAGCAEQMTPTFELSFSSAESAHAAAARLGALGYAVEQAHDSGSFALRFSRTVRADLEAIAPSLYLARTIGRQYGGEFEGWCNLAIP
jgi:hypothetical protein